jgi:hypothetical protein
LGYDYVLLILFYPKELLQKQSEDLTILCLFLPSR